MRLHPVAELPLQRTLLPFLHNLRCKTHQLALALDEVHTHVFPKGLLVFGFALPFTLGPQDAVTQVLEACSQGRLSTQVDDDVQQSTR